MEEEWNHPEKLILKKSYLEFGANKAYKNQESWSKKKRYLRNEIKVINNIISLQKKIIDTIYNQDVSDYRYYVITSKWVNLWKKYLQNSDLVGKPPPNVFENKEINDLPKMEHRKDFYLIPAGKVWREFNEHFCWKYIPEFVTSSIFGETIFQPSMRSEYYPSMPRYVDNQNLPRDSDNVNGQRDSYNPHLPRSSEREIEEMIHASTKSYLKSHPTHYMGKNESNSNYV